LRQYLFGFDVEEPGEINEREKQIAQLFAGARFVAGLGGVLKFADFFLDLSPNRPNVGPIETQMRSSSGDALGAASAGIALGTFPRADFDSPSFRSLALICNRCFRTEAVSCGIGSPANT